MSKKRGWFWRSDKRGTGLPRRFRPCLEELEDRTLLAVLTVNTAVDMVVNKWLTLREAILVANGEVALNTLTKQQKAQIQGDPTTGANTIKFAIGKGQQIIFVGKALPAITHTVTIDGTAPPGMKNLNQSIVIDGGLAGRASGLVLTTGKDGKGKDQSADSSFIKGLTIQHFKLHGISLVNVKYVTIGDTAAAIDGNVIINNGSAGVSITGAEARDNHLYRNRIGLDKNNVAQPNSIGVWLYDGTSKNDIGDGTRDHRNIISGNTNDGIAVLGVSFNTIDGNYIGTDFTGTKAVPNFNGIQILGGGYNTIGSLRTLKGTSLDDPANIISGNTTFGILIAGTGKAGQTTGNSILGNYIGVDSSGTKALLFKKNHNNMAFQSVAAL